MNEKSIYNMIISIINASFSLVFLTLGVIFQSLKGNILGIIFISIIYMVMITNYIFKSIFYSKNNSLSKKVFYRLAKITTDTYSSLITIYFLLNLPTNNKWLLITLIILILITEIILDALDKLTEIRYLSFAITYFILIFTLLNIYTINIMFVICLLSIIIDYTSNFLGRILNNKIILSFEIISVVLFGIFFVLI